MDRGGPGPESERSFFPGMSMVPGVTVPGAVVTGVTTGQGEGVCGAEEVPGQGHISTLEADTLSSLRPLFLPLSL